MVIGQTSPQLVAQKPQVGTDFIFGFALGPQKLVAQRTALRVGSVAIDRPDQGVAPRIGRETRRLKYGIGTVREGLYAHHPEGRPKLSKTQPIDLLENRQLGKLPGQICRRVVKGLVGQGPERGSRFSGPRQVQKQGVVGRETRRGVGAGRAHLVAEVDRRAVGRGGVGEVGRSIGDQEVGDRGAHVVVFPVVEIGTDDKIRTKIGAETLRYPGENIRIQLGFFGDGFAIGAVTGPCNVVEGKVVDLLVGVIVDACPCREIQPGSSLYVQLEVIDKTVDVRGIFFFVQSP